MRISRVSARAFGSLRDERLELADGLTVVYGPNEAGKSTWHAALLAALCGRWPTPKARTEPGIERYRPWSGEEWEVGAEVVLDDGRRVELRQDLAARHGWAIDLALGRDVTPEIAGVKGVPDATRWLGLDRVAFVATACVRQSHVTLATEDAAGIRGYVERVVSTGAGDDAASAEESAAAAIERVEAFRREQVGSDRATTRPLAVAQRELALAESTLADARARQEELGRRSSTTLELRERARVAAARLAQHEAAHARAQARALQERAVRARDLAALVAVPVGGPASPEPDPAPGEPVSHTVLSEPTAGPAVGDSVGNPVSPAPVVPPSPAEAARRRPALLLGSAAVLALAAAALIVAGQALPGAVVALGALVTGAIGFLYLGRATAVAAVPGPVSGSAPAPVVVPAPVAASAPVPAPVVAVPAVREDRSAKLALEALLEGGTLADLESRAESAAQHAQRLCRDLDAATLDALGAVTATELDRLRREHQEAERAAVLAEHAVAELERDHTPVAEAEERVAAARAEVDRLLALDDVLERTRQFLVRAQERVHREVAPTLAAAVSRELATLTAGRYVEAVVDPQSLEVQVRGPGTAPWRRVEALSHGTREQVYLLLRVALAERVVTTGESCPLLLDDVTVHADADRTARLLDTLLAVAQRRQVVVFTQQRQVRDWAHSTLDGTRHALRELHRVAPV